MNICIISQRYPYKDNMEFVFVKKLVDEWAKMGHHCVVVTTLPLTTFLRGRIEYKPRYYRDEVSPGCYVEVYNPRYINTGLNCCDVSIDQWMASCSIERLLKRLQIQFDFIYCHFFGSALKGFRYAQRNKVPFYIATGESEIETLSKPYPNYNWKVFREFTNGVVAVSSKNKEEAAKIGYIDDKKCQVFPNGTDTNIFKPLNRNECRKRLGLPLDVFIISCVGFICERKGQNRLLKAVRKLNDKKVKLLFMGSAAKAETFPLDGEEILFIGSVDNKSLPVYLCASDVFCLPTRAEGCCNAIIEALACGLPVISSNMPFNWDVLDDSDSIMIDPENVDDISNAIISLRNDETKRMQLSKGALDKSQSLDIHHRAESVINFILRQMK